MMTSLSLSLSVEELERSATERPLATSEVFTPNDFYGSATVLKRRAGLPPEFVIRATMPHGPSLSSRIWKNELDHPLPAALVQSAQQVELFRRQSSKIVQAIGSPLFHAAALIDTELVALRNGAAGTLVFPTHSTHHVTVEFDSAAFIEFLRTLPTEFRPVRVCLYWRDVQLGRHQPFLRAGFECTTAGHMFDPEFPFRLLRLLAAHERVVVNRMGSSAYYAAAFDRPVLLHAQVATYSGREARFLGELAPDFDLPGARQFLEACRLPLAKAAPIQREIARREMGIEFVPDPAALRAVLDALPPLLPANVSGSRQKPSRPAKPFKPSKPSSPFKLAQFTIEATTESLVQQLRPLVASHPRRVPGQVKLDGRPLAYADLHSLYHQAQQIFGQKLYEFRPETDQPLIVDGGAHIGLASLYFARRYPKGTIHAFEADPTIAAMLAANLGAFDLKQVTAHARALWTTNDGVAFDATADDSGHVTPAGRVRARIASVRLRDFLADQARPVDLLKLDIEGAEFAVLRDCDGALGRVRNLLIEVHRFRDADGRLGELLGVLERNGFDYALGDLHAATWIEPMAHTPFPACKSKHYIVTVFAWRAVPAEPALASPAPAPAATQIAPGPDAVLREALAHLNARRETEALRSFDQAIRAGAGSRVQYGRSVALGRLNRREEAVAALNQLTRLEPGDARARALADELAASEAGAGRLYIASYPRSGNTWLRLLLADVILQLHGHQTDTTLPIHADNIIPDLHVGGPEDVDRRLRLPCVLLKSHDHHDKLAPGRAVCLFRQAADALVSYYHFHHRYPRLAPKAADGIDAFCRRHVGHWRAHLQSFLDARRNGADILFVSYESLHAHGARRLEQVTRFIGLKADTAMCGRAMENHAFGRQQTAEKQAHGDKFAVPFFRSGQVNGAAGELSSETHDDLKAETDALYQTALALEPATL